MPPVGWHGYRASVRFKAWQNNPLNEELSTIRGEVPNASLSHLFTKTVERMVEGLDNSKNNASKSSELDQISSVVLHVKDQVIAINEDSKRYQMCREVLQDGLNGLVKVLEQRESTRKIKKLRQAETEAVEQDQKRYETVQRDELRRSPPNRNAEIQIFFMEDPGKDPYILKQDPLMTTYNDIIWHLNIHRIVQAPELWARREDPQVQPYTQSGRHWSFVLGEDPINEAVFDSVEMVNMSDYYTLALVDNGEKEIPIPIEVPIFGKKTCCDPACPSFGSHLTSLWTDVLVECARKFHDKGSSKVLELALDSRNFPLRKNELYLKVSQRTKAKP